MTTPSLHDEIGLSIAYADPIVKAGRSGFLGRFSDSLSAYEHTIEATKGFSSARVGATASFEELEDWLLHGLCRDIEVHDQDLEIVFNGFVNSLSLSIGPLTITRGPVSDILTRTMVRYTPLDTSTNPPSKGPAGTPTTLADNLDAQDLYGIWEKVINGGERMPYEALYLRNSWLAERAWPATTQQYAEGGAPSLSLEIGGYWMWLQAYIYDQVANAGTRTLTNKLIDVLAADPNGIFSTDYSFLAENGVLTSYYTNPNADATAWSTILPIISLGDEDYLRWTFGVYEGRKVRYQRIPYEVAYELRLGDPHLRTTGEGGGFVDPWQVRPARWLFYVDASTTRTQPPNLARRRRDVRYEFIESVTYTAPYGLSHTGGKTDTIQQKMAQLGLGSSGA